MTSLKLAIALSLMVSTVALRASADMTSPTASPVPAASPAPVNDYALVKDLSRYIVVMNKPVYVYNWFSSYGRNAVWRSKLSVNDPSGYDHVISGSHNYFQSMCTNDPLVDPPDCTSEDVMSMMGRQGYFGPGLYASTDPVATSSYGGGSSDWVLLQMRLPKGFRFASLVWNVKDDNFSTAGAAQLNALGCYGSSSSIRMVMDQFLRSGSTQGNNQGKSSSAQTKKCTLGIRRLLRDRLKIDGLYYGYNASSFEQCGDNLPLGAGSMNGNQIRGGAFVIANPEKLNPADVKVFTAKTTDAVKDRVRITTVFYKSAGPNYNSGAVPPKITATIQYYNTKGIPNAPGSQIIRWAANGCYTMTNYNNVCGDWYEVRDTNGISSYMPLPDPPVDASLNPLTPAPADPILSQTAPSNMQYFRTSNSNLIWPDLEGMPQDAGIGDWIKGSLLGCRDIAPFGAVPSLRYGRKYPTSTIDAEIDHGN